MSHAAIAMNPLRTSFGRSPPVPTSHSKWDESLEEWFLNDRRGLEHGYILATRPPGSETTAPLEFHIAPRGGLVPRVTADGLGVHFHDEAGAPVLTYTGLKVWDTDGATLRQQRHRSEPGSIQQ